jgi:hypothetical protein
MARTFVRVLLATATVAVYPLLLAGPAAAAGSPPAPVVTSPAGSNPYVLVGHQPVHFAGTVAGPVDQFDVVNVIHDDGSGDPPILCSASLAANQTSWSCDPANPLAVGTYTIDVVWAAQDPVFTAPPLKRVFTLHIVTTLPAPTPTPSHLPTKVPSGAPTGVPTAAGPPGTTPSATPSGAPSATAPPSATTTAKPSTTGTPSASTSPVVIPTAIGPTGGATPSIPATVGPGPSGTSPGVPGGWRAVDHPTTVLAIAAAAFTLLTLVGPSGLAMASGLALGGVAGAGETLGSTLGSTFGSTLGSTAAGAAALGGGAGHAKGSVTGSKTKSERFSGEGAGPGDRSWTWRTPGWARLDAWSLALPVWLARRSPLTARVLADGAYLRAVVGSLWTLGLGAGFALGYDGAHRTGGLPVPPPLGLTAALLALAIADATWGAAGVLGFAVGMLVRHSDLLSTAVQVRSFLGLAALWFAIPLIAAAARPFRRSVLGRSGTYRWDRLADGVIAALIAGWAVQKTAKGMPGLSGLDLPIAHDAGRLAVLAIAAVLVRVAIEEWCAWRYPLRLSAVATGKLPTAGTGQRLFATLVRTALFVFLAAAFLGECRELWVGAALFALPQMLTIFEDSFPNSSRLHAVLPEGVVKVLVMLVVGTLFGHLVHSMLHSPERMLRDGFVLMALPALLLSLLALVGRDGPAARWTWLRQAIGAVVVAATVWLVVTGW